MLLAFDIQMLEPKPYDYAKYVVDNIHTSFVNFNDVEYPNFRHYSLLMHMIFYYGNLRGMWGAKLKLNVRETNGEERPNLG